MNYFPNGNEEIELIKFISKYQYLKSDDAKHFFSSSKYYKQRISNLIKKKFLKRIKLNLVLDKIGIEYSQMCNFEYNRLNRNKSYSVRLLYISNLASFYFNCKTVKFIPSFDIKDKEMFTVTARKFIGVLQINSFDYLTYHISNNHDNRYIGSVIYDIQKEKNYKNIIVLTSDIQKININDFIFGMNRVLLIEDTEVNRENLKYLHSINWQNIISKYYKNRVFISEYNFCDYTDYKNIYVSCFYFFDTEKINRIKNFLRENKNRNIDIICSETLSNSIKKELPNAHYINVNLEEYIDKEIFVYD